MNRFSWLAALAIAVWLAWLGLVGLLFAMLKLSVWHPHFLPVTGLLVVMLATGLVLLAGGVWRLFRGPRRLHALAFLLLGLPPLGFLSGHLMYGFGTAYGRQINLSPALRVLVPLGESLLDLIARFQYPQRTAGERVVMISQPVDNAREQVAAMDRHIRALEARLGRKGTRRIHWVRGPILGLQGRALLSMCMGSQTEGHREQADQEGLTQLDRHEVAHVVLSQFCSSEMEPPAILMEGWADFAAAADTKELRLRALSQREEGRTFTLRELLGPKWYGRHDYPVYVQGAILVDYILRQFGSDRFVELYATCRRSTFAADCQRILGVSIDQLDRDYWADLDKLVGPGGYRRLWLESLPLGPKVDPAEWKRFVGDYLAAAERVRALYQHVRLTSEWQHQAVDTKGQITTSTTRYEIKRSGPIRAVRILSKDFEDVFLAAPERSFHATRQSSAGAWEIRQDPGVSPAQAYRRAARRIEESDLVYSSTFPLLELADLSINLVSPLNLRVTRLERISENGHRFIVLELEGRPEHPWFRKNTLRISADDWRAVRDETVSEKGYVWNRDLVYETVDGVPLLKLSRGEGQWDDGTRGKITLIVLDRKLGPVPEDEFAPERLLGNAPVHRVSRKADPMPVSPFLTWFWLPLVLGACSLAAGAVLELLARRSPKTL